MTTTDRRGVVVSATDPSQGSVPNPDLAYKTAVRAATTGANITLSGLQTFDGIALAAGDRVLVKDQTDATTNGIYAASSGNWTRTTDAASNLQWAPGTQVLVAEGTVNGGHAFYLNVDAAVVIGTTALVFSVENPVGLLPANNLSDVANAARAYDNLSKHGADIPSAATLNLETATGNLVDVTGTTTITAITLSEGHERTVRFTGALTLTNGASLVLPGGANITTAAGDVAVFRGYAGGVVRCVGYLRIGNYPAGAAPVPPQGRLTLTSGVAVTTTDVSGATMVYYTPTLLGQSVPLYDGVGFVNTDTGGELSNDTTQGATGKAGPAAVSANSIYFLLVWNDGGTIRLTRSPAWSLDTVVGTGAGSAEVQFIKGVPTNKWAITNGPAANRGTIVGAVRTNGSSQLVDSAAFRWVSNIGLAAVPRPMKVIETTSSWSYTTATYRQANANSANQLDYLQAFSGGKVDAEVDAPWLNSTSGVAARVGIDLDTLDTTNLNNCIATFGSTGTGTGVLSSTARTTLISGAGRHVLIWKEWSSASGTTTWFGNNSGTTIQAGMVGSVPN